MLFRSGSSFIGQAAASGLGATAETAVPVGSTISELASGVGGGAAGSSGLASAAGLAPSLTGGLTSALTQQVPGALKSLAGGQAPGMTPEMIQKGREAQAWNQAEEDKQTREGQALSQNVFTPHAGLAEGGAVGLENGDFILPADVVSALGNGSTKAGANFLNDFFGVA